MCSGKHRRQYSFFDDVSWTFEFKIISLETMTAIMSLKLAYCTPCFVTLFIVNVISFNMNIFDFSRASLLLTPSSVSEIGVLTPWSGNLNPFNFSGSAVLSTQLANEKAARSAYASKGYSNKRARQMRIIN